VAAACGVPLQQALAVTALFVRIIRRSKGDQCDAGKTSVMLAAGIFLISVLAGCEAKPEEKHYPIQAVVIAVELPKKTDHRKTWQHSRN